MNTSIEDARYFLSIFDSNKDMEAFRQGMELLIEIINSDTDSNKKVAKNIFSSYLAKASQVVAEMMKPYMRELDQTKDFYKSKDIPLSTAMLNRFLEITDDEVGVIVAEFVVFLIDNKEHIDLERKKYKD